MKRREDRLHQNVFRLAVCLALLGWPLVGIGAEWKLGDRAVLKTATQEEGGKVLSEPDLFIKAMSPFDLAVRLKTNDGPTRETYLRQAASQVLPFTEEDERRLQAALEILLPQLAKWELPWPRETLLVKATAEHEAGAAYCRGPVVVLPESRLTPDADKLAKLLAHELFHVLSNQNPILRARLYRLVGFQHGGRLVLPEAWEQRRITNPDAPTLEHYARLKIGERETAVVPLLYAEPAEFDPQSSKGLFGYLQFKLLEILPSEQGLKPALNEQDELQLHSVADAPAYFELIGRNTNYIIHPEEVLAENFVLLVFEAENTPTPKLLESMAEELRLQPE